MLPKVFINKIDKSIKNNKESYYYKGNEPIIIDDADINVKETINEIFNGDKIKVDDIVNIKKAN